MTMRAYRLLAIAFLLGGSLLAQQQEPDYGGPAILSRGWTPSSQRSGDLVRLRPYLGVSGVYDSALTPVSVDETGAIPEHDGYGVQADLGLYGYHSWRRTILGLDYRGNLRHYTQQTYYDGFDNFLSLGLTHQASRRVTFSLRESAGIFSRSFGTYGAAGFYDPAFTDVPSDELFDGRTLYVQTMGDLTIQQGARLSFNMGADNFIVRRRSSALFGVTGYRARGDISRQLGRSQALSVDYNFTHYKFDNAFGASDIHSLGLGYATRIGRFWEFAIRAGAQRVESQGVRQVQIDPVIAAIIGQRVGVEAIYRLNYVPDGDVRLTRDFRNSSLSLRYHRGINSGNGVFLTSQYESADVSYSYTGLRRWNVGFSGGYESYSSMALTAGKYQGYRGGIGVTYRLSESMNFTSRFDARHFDTGSSTSFQRDQLRATVGFVFSPGEVPLSLW